MEIEKYIKIKKQLEKLREFARDRMVEEIGEVDVSGSIRNFEGTFSRATFYLNVIEIMDRFLNAIKK